ncbi:MAG TPA: polysaccharide deacetylase family protein [Thermodesulfobacteriota bacterium]|nr:polysaccharide deacetylase family protein [Thermodesulfobacteriota bacterium]
MHCPANHGKNSLLKGALCVYCGSPVKKKCRVKTGKLPFCESSCETFYSVRKAVENLFIRLKTKNAAPSLGRALEKSLFFLFKERNIKPSASRRHGFVANLCVSAFLAETRMKTSANGFLAAIRPSRVAKHLLDSASERLTRLCSYSAYAIRRLAKTTFAAIRLSPVISFALVILIMSGVARSAGSLLSFLYLLRNDSFYLASKTSKLFKKTWLRLAPFARDVIRPLPLRTGFYLSVAAIGSIGLRENLRNGYYDIFSDIEKPEIISSRENTVAALPEKTYETVPMDSVIETEPAPAKDLETRSIPKPEEKPRIPIKVAALIKEIPINKKQRKETAFIKLRPPKPLIMPPPAPAPPDITRGGTEKKELCLTFDGGSEAFDSALILDTLRKRGIRTTIFLTGGFIQKFPDIVRTIAADGHEVGNHTLSHPHLTTFERNRRHSTLPGVTKEFLLRELMTTERLFKETTGRDMARLWRAPYGEVNEDIRAWAFEKGYAHVGWTTDYALRESLDTLDWVKDASSKHYRTAGEIKERVLGFGKNSNGLNGGIALMHLSTDRAEDKLSSILGELIDELERRGYEFVKASTIMEGNADMAKFMAKMKEADTGQTALKPVAMQERRDAIR